MAHRCLKDRLKSISRPRNIARYHDYVRVASKCRRQPSLQRPPLNLVQAGSIRVPLASPNVIGVVNSRGNSTLPCFQIRLYLNHLLQSPEDFFGFATLSLNPEELQLSVKKTLGADWDPNLVSDIYARQVLYVGIYDGYVSPFTRL